MPVRCDGQLLLVIKQCFRHQRAGRAGLDTFAAANAGAGSHIIAKIEHDMRVCTAAGKADHIIDLHLAACPDAQSTLDAGIHIHRDGWMAAVGFWREFWRETACLDVLLGCIFP